MNRARRKGPPCRATFLIPVLVLVILFQFLVILRLEVHEHPEVIHELESLEEAGVAMIEDSVGYPQPHLTTGRGPVKFPLGAHVPKPNAVDTSVFTRRQWSVVRAIRHGWHSYKRCALGHDILITNGSRCSYQDWGQPPLSTDVADSETSKQASDEAANATRGLAVTLIESLDTLWLAGERTEFAFAVNWLRHNHTWDVDVELSLFETTIRLLGGLLSSYELSGEELLLEMAFDLGERLLAGFIGEDGNDVVVPLATVNIRYRNSSQPSWMGKFQSLSEITTIQLEFSKLSVLTGDERFASKANKIMPFVFGALDKSPHKLPSGYIHRFLPYFDGRKSGITLGARGDSFYEYLVKQWILTNRTSEVLERYYDEIRTDIHNYLVVQLDDDHAFLSEGEFYGSWKILSMDHLVCFASGMFLLGRQVDDSRLLAKDTQVAEGLARVCSDAYAMTPTGLGPDIVTMQRIPVEQGRISPPGQSKKGRTRATAHNKGLVNRRRYGEYEMQPESWHYIQRPETLEALFYVKRFATAEGTTEITTSTTSDSSVQEWEDKAWRIFQSIETFLKRPYGYTGIHNVTVDPYQGMMPQNTTTREAFSKLPALNDTHKMESFFMAETLKYALLVFEDPQLARRKSSKMLLPLDSWVFNTEAHPLRIFDPTRDALLQGNASATLREALKIARAPPPEPEVFGWQERPW